MTQVPSPAISFVGRHNSGKTTVMEALIAELTRRNYDVGTVKHHSHGDFEIDVAGKDSYRHRVAGSKETVIAAPGKLARVQIIDYEPDVVEIVNTMPGHDLVMVEGYRHSSLPTIEIMRAGNARDVVVARAFAAAAEEGLPLGADLSALPKSDGVFALDIVGKAPSAHTVALVTDIMLAAQAAEYYGLPVFGLNDVDSLSDWLVAHYVRPRLTVAIQAGGESTRMGHPKEIVPFAGRPLICHLVDRLSDIADELIITTNTPENLLFLSKEYPKLKIRFVRDKRPERSALGGLETALEAATCPYVAAVACDMPFASPELIVAEAQEMYQTGVDMVIPSNNHGYEPFHAVYRKDTCLPAIKVALDAGERQVQSFYHDPELEFVSYTHDRVLKVEPRGGCFFNINTPEDLLRAQAVHLDY